MTLGSSQAVPAIYWLSVMTSARPMHVELLLLENWQCSNNNDGINVSAYTAGIGERAHARIKSSP